MSKFILISGKAGSGKDTVAGFIEDQLTDLKQTVLHTAYGDLVKHVCTKFFGWNGVKDEYGRTLMQTIGTNVARKKDENFWVNATLNLVDMFSSYFDYVIISDVRFPNELTEVKNRYDDVLYINVERPNLVSALTENQQKHESENSMDGVMPDYTIYNDGDLNDLRMSVIELVGQKLM